MLYDPARHEAPQAIDWDPDRAQGAIERIVRDTEAHLSERTWWPVHRRDVEPGDADVPSTTLYFGAPGTMLAARFLHERTGDARWAELFRDTAATLWSQLEWSADHGCRYWTQDLYGRRTTYLDGMHGFVATASPLIRGRRLLGDADW